MPAAQNDLAISYYKAAEMHDAEGRTREALASLERAAAIQSQLAAADPDNTRARLETVTNDSFRGRLLAKLGQREPSLASLTRAIDVCRTLSRGNPDNVELRIAVALALEARGDGLRDLGRAKAGAATDDASIARDYDEAIGILTALDEQGVIEGTDQTTLDTLRKKRNSNDP